MTPLTPERGTGCSGIGEHVLDAPVVGLDPHQPDAEVERRVADQVVHVEAELGVGVEGEQPAARLDGDAGRGQRMAHAGLGVLADHLDERRLERLVAIGVDEISYRRHHRYLTTVADHRTGAIVWCAPGRNSATLQGFFDELGELLKAPDFTPEQLGPLGAKYGLEFQPDSVQELCAEHGLVFPE